MKSEENKITEVSPKLLHGCDMNSFYATSMEMHDDYTWYQDTQGQTHIILNSLEVDRGRRVAKVDNVHAAKDIADAVRAAGLEKTYSNMILQLIGMDKGWSKNKDISIEVPHNFPLGIAQILQEKGLVLKPIPEIFPNREIKTLDEIEKVRHCQQINEQGFLRAFEIFKVAKINKDLTLSWNSKPLTSEIVQGEMNKVIAGLGGIGFNGGPIVACGSQSADPHERGTGVLKANEFIIIDSFPQGGNFYNGDLTRTILKGEASDWHLATYDAVKQAQQIGIDTAKAGVTGAEVHNAVDGKLIELGYDTGVDEQGRNYGFFHSTGHGVGLDVHDGGAGIYPNNHEPLQENMIVTIEPGVYYPEKGGVRLEDIVAITKDGIDNLTTLPKELVIK